MNSLNNFLTKLLVISFLSIHLLNHSQIFDFNKKSDFEKVKNSFDTISLNNYLLNHPKAKKYNPIIIERLSCLRKIYAFDKISNSKDSNDFQSLIARFESDNVNCSELEGNVSIIDKAKSKLEQIRISSKWETYKTNCNSLLFIADQESLESCLNSINQFLLQYPNADDLIRLEANKIKQKTEDELNWVKASKIYTIEAFQSYNNDNSNKIKAYNKLCDEKIRELESWETISKNGKHSEIVSFKKQFPSSKFVKENQIDEKLKLIEQKDWEKAKKINSVTGFDNFMAKYEDGFYYDQAADKIHNLLSHLPNNMAEIIHSLSEKMDLESLRDPHESFISITNKTVQVIKVQFTGSSSKAIIIQPGSSKEFSLRNGLYTVIVSCPLDTDVLPLKGQQEFRGYLDYVGKFSITTTIK